MTPEERQAWRWAYAKDPRVVSERWMDGIQDDFSYDPESGRLWRITRDGLRLISSVSKAGRLVTLYKGRVRYATRIIWALEYGRAPIGVIDHINGNRADDRLANLRECTQAQNNKNRRGSCVGRSGYRGVRRLPSGKFQARISGGGEAVGTFDTAAEASEAYEAEARRRFAEFYPERQVRGIGEAAK